MPVILMHQASAGCPPWTRRGSAGWLRRPRQGQLGVATEARAEACGMAARGHAWAALRGGKGHAKAAHHGRGALGCRRGHTPCWGCAGWPRGAAPGPREMPMEAVTGAHGLAMLAKLVSVPPPSMPARSRVPSRHLRYYDTPGRFSVSLERGILVFLHVAPHGRSWKRMPVWTIMSVREENFQEWTNKKDLKFGC